MHELSIAMGIADAALEEAPRGAGLIDAAGRDVASYVSTIGAM
jgi:hypothetical protein